MATAATLMGDRHLSYLLRGGIQIQVENPTTADVLEPVPGIGRAVSRIGLGTWAIGGWMWGGTDDRESIRTIHAALDRGISLFDTAPVYGFGHSEEIIGQTISRLAVETK